MDTLPDEVLIIISQELSNDDISILKYINRHILKIIINNYNSLINNNIIKNLKTIQYISKESNNLQVNFREEKYRQIVCDKYGLPNKVITTRDYCLKVYDIKNKTVISGGSTRNQLGTDFYFTIYGERVPNLIYPVQHNTREPYFIINDYIFQQRSNQLYVYNNHGKINTFPCRTKIQRIKFSYHTYVVSCKNDVTLIIGNNFKLIDVIHNIHHIDHYYDKYFIVGKTGPAAYITIWVNEKSINGPYITSFIIQDYLYLIDDSSNITIMDIINRKFIDKIINKHFIYKLHEKYIIYRDTNTLYRICN